MSEFDRDPYQGRPKILFVGWPESSHTHSWIDLLAEAPFNVRLFCLPSAAPPEAWPVRSYLTAPGLPCRNEPKRRTVVLPTPPSGWRRIKSRLMPRDRTTLHAHDAEGALAAIIGAWQPHVVHTLGFDAASYLYLRTRQRHGVAGIGRWVAQARGGPDIALQRYSPDKLPLIREVLSSCDHFIADNEQNYEIALSLGLAEHKIKEPGMGVVSGPGGLDVEHLRARWTRLPSQRERVIVWPKAYEISTAKAMPVFEAILNAWGRLQPCRIEMLWMTQPEVRIWYEKLFPDHIKRHCPTHGRLSREETLEHLARARVMLAPSLSDGIPNTMLEAMALGAAPIVSPLDTIEPVVRHEENVFFARNLYPDEIAGALVRLMSDDALVDQMAQNNVVLVRALADRAEVRRRALVFYEAVAEQAMHQT